MSEKDVVSQLHELAQLRQVGALAEDEFIAAKARLLDDAPPSPWTPTAGGHGAAGPRRVDDGAPLPPSGPEVGVAGPSTAPPKACVPARQRIQNALPVLVLAFAMYTVGELLGIYLVRAVAFGIVTGLGLAAIVVMRWALD